MVVLRIQEQTFVDGQKNAILRLDNRTEYPLQIHDPFADDPQQERDLEWYFEKYLTFPFIQDVRVKRAAASIRIYGEALFAQVFADVGALFAYKQARQHGLHTLQVEIAGSSTFQRLHWEALYDPEIGEHLSLHAVIVRQNTVPQVMPATMQRATTINVLVVVARPGGEHDVGYRTISRPLMDELERIQLPVNVTLLRPGTYRALATHLEQTTRAHGVGHYHLIHFDVHGALIDHAHLQAGVQTNRYLYTTRFGRPPLGTYSGDKAFLFLEGEQDEQYDPVEAGELTKLLHLHQIPLVLLNACQSGKLSSEMETSLGSSLIQAGVQTVIAMGYSVTVSAAEVLMSTLYQAVFQQKPLPEALCQARHALANHKERQAYYNQRIELEDWLLPILFQNQPVTLAVQPFTPQGAEAFYEGKAAQYKPPQQPTYGFVGRDLDILYIEKHLLMMRNLLLIRGMGGVGKTTLLHHLASWWQRTGLVQDVFYFEYDKRAWTRQQIMHTIAKKLLDKYEIRTFQSLSLDAQQVRLAQLLKSTRYLLILDNLESITGSKLVVKHTLSLKAQEALRLLLVDLVGGQTLVLLGSRSAEKWLAKGTFEENRYELAGLDQEAASQLAERVLERVGATKYRSDPKLPELLKLLDGFPLAIEVVLANLTHQIPAEVLVALQEGNTDLQVGTSEKRTENILRCVDYSYRNLSAEAQQLLLCLAPFTSVLSKDLLGMYVGALQHQPALADLSFSIWAEMIQEAEQWGLLSPDPDMPSYLRMQPVLSYFLHQSLASQEELHIAVETAFYEYYVALSQFLLGLLGSNQSQEQQIGLLMTNYEYENMLTSLQFALREKISLLAIYSPLEVYLKRREDYQHGQDLDRLLLAGLEVHPLGSQAEPLQMEWLIILNGIANRQMFIKQYEFAKKLYLNILKIFESMSFKEKQRFPLPASIFHNLGNVAQEQRQLEQAEQYYQRALQIYVEFKDRYLQGRIYHSLGTVAQERRQWQQAKSYYLQALQILIESEHRYEQARTYHQLGIIAQEEQQWKEAENYYQQALKLYVEFEDRYSQAAVYNNLGIIAHEQRQWDREEENILEALHISLEFNDTHHSFIIFRSLARLWQERKTTGLLKSIAAIMGAPQEVVVYLLQRLAEPPHEKPEEE
jgi:Tfp pilus assembly protein PilF